MRAAIPQEVMPEGVVSPLLETIPQHFIPPEVVQSVHGSLFDIHSSYTADRSSTLLCLLLLDMPIHGS